MLPFLHLILNHIKLLVLLLQSVFEEFLLLEELTAQLLHLPLLLHSSLKVFLAGEASGGDEFLRIIVGLALNLEVHQPLEGDHPAPLFKYGGKAEVVHIIV